MELLARLVYVSAPIHSFSQHIPSLALAFINGISHFFLLYQVLHRTRDGIDIPTLLRALFLSARLTPQDTSIDEYELRMPYVKELRVEGPVLCGGHHCRTFCRS